MNTKQIKTLYESPDVKIYETRVRSVICSSTTGRIDPMSWNSETTDGDAWN